MGKKKKIEQCRGQYDLPDFKFENYEYRIDVDEAGRETVTISRDALRKLRLLFNGAWWEFYAGWCCDRETNKVSADLYDNCLDECRGRIKVVDALLNLFTTVSQEEQNQE